MGGGNKVKGKKRVLEKGKRKKVRKAVGGEAQFAEAKIRTDKCYLWNLTIKLASPVYLTNSGILRSRRFGA
jgi:hypothetical protein